MKRIGVITKPNNPEAIKACNEVARWLKERSIEIYVDSAISLDVENIKCCSASELPERVDLIIVLGGDGTILYTARLLNGKKTPILGVNLGGLGFLTAVKRDELYSALEKVIKDEFEVEERMMLSVNLCRNGKIISNYSVLNDVVVKGTLARLISLETRINEEYVNTYRADGLIVATPTGSTAYSLSAGGPILYPTIHSITLAPICPFNLTNRPVVIPDWMNIKVIIRGKQCKPFLTVDGQVDQPLEDGDVIDIKRSESSIYLLKCPGKSYFDILGERLLWERKN